MGLHSRVAGEDPQWESDKLQTPSLLEAQRLFLLEDLNQKPSIKRLTDTHWSARPAQLPTGDKAHVQLCVSLIKKKKISFMWNSSRWQIYAISPLNK